MASPETGLVRSEACSWAAILEWDGSPGPATAVGAVQEILVGLERQLTELPAGTGAHTPISDPDHPVRLKISVRGLRAVRDVLAQQQHSGADHNGTDRGGEVVAYTEAGQELARVLIEPAGIESSGFRVGMYGATGWSTDDPLCTADAASTQGAESGE
ncbi:hypothetical protein [Homoserinimonas sp. OAct 916]|uniref:hypothetical protein n=1 Tax=Homoserinimonas sp. OAct 916 TaxID=2211450 RepID=UPI001300A036|nr:hypothetical protein [Homoserinimonas sp. OAct 916]